MSSFCNLKLIPCFRITGVRAEFLVSALGTSLLLGIMVVGVWDSYLFWDLVLSTKMKMKEKRK